MKKNLFYIPLVALAMASCSENDFSKQPGGPEDEAGSSYITINIVNGSDATRAEGDAQYENGIKGENDVKSVTFFFFHGDGTIAPVRRDGKFYFTASPDEDKENSKENVEKIMKATIVIESKEGDLLPAGIVAVVNPTTDMMNRLTNPAIVTNINAFNYALDLSLEETTDFVMTNSIYVDDEYGFIQATPVLLEHYQSTSELAEKNPVEIFVERAVGKVRVNLNNTTLVPVTINGEKYYDTGVKYTDATYDDEGHIISTDHTQKNIYVKLSNWNTTARALGSNLLKNIDTSWGEKLLGESEPWNNSGYHRSFWAINPTKYFGRDESNALVEKDFGIGYYDYYDADSKPFEVTTKDVNWTYLQENAADPVLGYTKTPSDVIIAGQLVDEKGNPLGLADVGGVKYVVEYGDQTVNGKHATNTSHGETVVKMAVLYYLKSSPIYQVKSEDTGLTIREIKPSDLELVTGQEMKKRGYPALDYKVYPQLIKTTGSIQGNDVDDLWSYDSKIDSPDRVFLTADEVNQALFDLGGAKVWTEGLTYYYFPIRHLGPDATDEGHDAVGRYGVVRNHIYDATITELTGLGTPVYDPEEIIEPQKPGNDETYIAARINILSWRIVGQDVKLEW